MSAPSESSTKEIQQFGHEMLHGLGTALNVDGAQWVIGAGTQYPAAPCFDLAIVVFSYTPSLLILPAA
jgi:2-keto-3-deoxy-6-phosphogluconate aldolase